MTYVLGITAIALAIVSVIGAISTRFALNTGNRARARRTAPLFIGSGILALGLLLGAIEYSRSEERGRRGSSDALPRTSP